MTQERNGNIQLGSYTRIYVSPSELKTKLEIKDSRATGIHQASIKVLSPEQDGGGLIVTANELAFRMQVNPDGSWQHLAICHGTITGALRPTISLSQGELYDYEFNSSYLSNMMVKQESIEVVMEAGETKASNEKYSVVFDPPRLVQLEMLSTSPGGVMSRLGITETETGLLISSDNIGAWGEETTVQLGLLRGQGFKITKEDISSIENLGASYQESYGFQDLGKMMEEADGSEAVYTEVGVKLMQAMGKLLVFEGHDK